ncbi:MAG: Gfo/Idh/MocA family oxidoreductase [Bryobacterales bacterium]|nr:Gfo/Idh/MocA family oxidoreductase [Bryobacterales bacterium]
MRVGLVGTGAIAHKHGDSYREIGYELVACSNRGRAKGEEFAAKYGCAFVPGVRDLCARPDIDYVDVCTFPDSHVQVCRWAAENGKHVLLQKPMALTLEECRTMIALCREAGVGLGVVSQHRFDECAVFLKTALEAGRLGRLLQLDGYVKWHRPQAYYDRPGKGTWAVEGGGALINQGIHTADVMQYLAGPVRRVFAHWQLGATHAMEAEDLINAVLVYETGAGGVLQAATSTWPGYPERIEIHGSKGTAVITGDQLTAWDVDGDPGDDAPLSAGVDSGAADPMAISIENLKSQFLEFGEAVSHGREPLVSGSEGLAALRLVLGVYQSARERAPVDLR